MINPYIYICTVVDTVDGDTVDVLIDLGFYVVIERRIRISGVDTAEIYGVKHNSDEYERGLEHKRFTETWIQDVRDRSSFAFPFNVITEKIGKYGRYSGTIVDRETGETLNQALIGEYGDEVADS